MNEDLLKAIYDDYLSDKGTYDQFKTDMRNPDVRRFVYEDYLKDKGTYDQFNRDLGLLNDTQPKEEEEETNPFYKKLDGLGSFGKIIKGGLKGIEKIGTAINQGIDQGANVSEAINAMTGNTLDQTEAEELSKILLNSNGSKLVKKSGKLVPAEGTYTEKFMQEGGEKKMSLMEHAGLIIESMAQSGAMMLRGAIDVFTEKESAAIIAGGAGVGAATSVGLGSIIPGAGNILTGTLGAFSGSMGALSSQLEAAGVFYDELNKELIKRGKDITANNILEIVNNEEWSSRTGKKASVKGATVGTIDGLTMMVTAGLGGKAGSKVIGNLLSKEGAKSIFKTAVKTELADAVGGGAGEALSQKAIGEDIDWKGVYLEVAGSTIGFATAGHAYTKAILDTKRQVKEATIKGEPVSEIDKKVAEKPLSAPYLVDAITEEREAIEKGDLDLHKTAVEKQKISLAGVAPILNKEQFVEQIEALQQTHDISDEEKAGLYSEFDKYKGYSDSIPLDVVPSIKSMAIIEIDEREIKKVEIARLQDLINKSDESIKPRFQTQIDELNGQIDVHNENINKIIDNKEIKVKQDINDDEFNSFIDKNEVSAERLSDIAKKIKNKENLSERENAIFIANTNEVNNIIKTDGVIEGVNDGVNPVVLEDKLSELESLTKDMSSKIRNASKTDERLGDVKTTSLLSDFFDKMGEFDSNRINDKTNYIKEFTNLLNRKDFNESFSGRVNKKNKAILEVLGDGDLEQGRKVIETVKTAYNEFKNIQAVNLKANVNKSEISTEEQLDTKISDIETKKVSDIKTTLTNIKNFQKPEIKLSEFPSDKIKRTEKENLRKTIEEANSKINEEFSEFQKMLDNIKKNDCI